MKKYEILAPAGSIDSFYAAINAGCDAVYLGGMKFGARSYADNFDEKTLIEVVEYAHLHNVKVYVTVNTVLFEDEITQALSFIGFLNEHNFDAVIIQDFGLLNLVVKRYPLIKVHASTQMNIHSVEEAKLLKSLGVKRITLGREVSIDTINEIKEQVDIEIEVFVHGAICISYSGNCYMSSLIGKRSGNRGRCAGSCRLEYSLDGKNYRYLLSAKDLMTIDMIGELLDIGVDSFKIEGRMKRKEYVLQTVSSYKKAIEGYLASKEVDLEIEKRDLKTIFNRQFTKGFIFNDSNSNLVNSTSPNHQGIKVGKVINSTPAQTQIVLSEDIHQGDGLRFVGRVTDAVIVNQVRVNGLLQNHASKGDVVTLRTHVDNLYKADIYKTTDALQLEKLNKLTSQPRVLKGKCYQENEDLVFVITDGTYNGIAKTHILDEAKSSYNQRIKEQLMKCGPNYILEDLEIDLQKELFVQVSSLNQLRRDAINNYEECLLEIKNVVAKDFDYCAIVCTQHQQLLSARVKTEAQLQAALESNIEMIYVANYRLYKQYEQLSQIYYAPSRVNSLVDKKRVLTSGFNNIKDNQLSVYNNIANSYSMRSFVEMGATELGISIEVDIGNLKKMINNYQMRYHSLPNMQYMVYGYYELMVMKYCLINDYYHYDKLGCDECTKKQHYLFDRMGYKFPLIKDENCNLKVLNSRRIHLIDYLDQLIALKINNLLLDFTIESYDETKLVIEMYQDKMKGNNSFQTIDNVTYGHLMKGVL